MWGGEQIICDNIRCTDELMDLAMGEFLLTLHTEPGTITWRSNNERQRDQTLNLVWMREDLQPDRYVDVLLHKQTRSDHAIIK